MSSLLTRPAVKYGLVALLIAIIYLSITLLGSGLQTIPLSRKIFELPHSFQPNENENGTPALLPLEAAKDYCALRHWEPYPKRDQKRKVYDLFMINTEIDWLEIRMGELAPEVDYFIVLESAVDFHNRPKPLYVENNWSRFAKFHHKIIHHVLNVTGHTLSDAWAREHFSRNAMMDQVFPTLTGDQEVQQGDVIVVSDVDEIPRPEIIKSLRNCQFPRRLGLRTVYFRYSFQWILRDEQCGHRHPQATFYEGPNTVRPEDLRMGKVDAEIWNAGWHCSSCLGSLKDMVNKVTSFSHSEFNQPDFRDPAKILQRVRQGRDPYNRTAKIYDRIDRNPDIPQYLLKHQDEFAYLVNRDLPSANFKDYKDFNFS